MDGCQLCDVRCSVATVLTVNSSTRGQHNSCNTTECKLHTETLMSKKIKFYGFGSLAKLNVLSDKIRTQAKLRSRDSGDNAYSSSVDDL